MYTAQKKGMEIARSACADVGHQKNLPKNPDGTPQKPLTRKETLERDRQWAKKHRHNTDAELLEYLRRTAEEMGYTPQMREVHGGHYIGQRFCGWNIAVTLAGLPLGRKMKKPTTQQMQIYKNRCANRAKMSAEAKASLNQ